MPRWKPPSLEIYVMQHTYLSGGAARRGTLIFLRDQIRAGLFPGPTSNYRGTFTRWAATLPAEHVVPANHLWREYETWCRQSKQRYEDDKRQRALKLLKGQSSTEKRKTYSLMDLIR